MGLLQVSEMAIDTGLMRKLYEELETPDDAVHAIAEALVADIGEHWSAGVSAPGEAPGVQSGTLKGSIHSARLSQAVWAVRDGTEYGATLEFGYTNEFGYLLAARPWMVPAVERVSRTYPEGVFRAKIQATVA